MPESQKKQKYQGHLLLVYWQPKPNREFRYGCKIYRIKAERQKAINPKTSDCHNLCVANLFWYESDKAAIAAAKQHVNLNLKPREQWINQT